MEHEKLMRALGLCLKARRLVVGSEQVVEALRGKTKPQLALGASDNSANTAKRLADKCAYYEVEYHTLTVDGNALSDALGRSGRVAAVAITDENLARLVRGAMKQEHS